MKTRAIAMALAAGLFSQGLFFAVQSYFLLSNQLDAIVSLARFAGWYSLVFFLADGNSGLVFGALRSKFSNDDIRGGYLAFRLVAFVLGCLAGISYAFIDPTEGLPIALGTVVALAIRSPWLDGFLDARGKLPVAALLANSWIACVCVLVGLAGVADPTMVSLGAVFGSVVMAVGHLLVNKPGERLSISALKGTKSIPVFAEIWRFLGLYGYGQVYGRAAQFFLASLGTGPVIALALYGKQIFNLSGLAVSYIRRLEVHRSAGRVTSAWRVSELASSGLIQAAAAALSSVVIAYVGIRSGAVAAMIVVIVWQVMEKISGNCIYAFQLMNRHGLGYISLAGVSFMGGIGLFIASSSGAIYYLAFETLAFVAVFFVWIVSYRAHLSTI